ncbi:MAG: PTS sugar transporter subunit IIC [bacterium]
MTMLVELAKSAAIGGLIFLDSSSVAQIMISQPIVCAPLIGWYLGNWQIGLLIGALLELLWIGKLPIGSHIPPEAPISAMTATIIYIFLTRGMQVPIGTFVLAISICCGILNGFIGGELTIKIRKFNNRFNVMADRYTATGSYLGIEFICLLAIGLVWLTAALLIYLGTWIPILILSHWSPVLLQINILKYTLILLVAVGIAVILDLFRIHNRKRAFIIGLAAGFILAGVITYLMR